MECNKDEAINARMIAENKLATGDFKGALKMAQKAQKLYPDLENISHLLAVCEVHCAAEIKLLGSEMNWYGILQVQQFADDAIIKKQYRKLALLLHPDKNKFAGAEAAFKLVGEANRVLTEQNNRLSYDMKFKSSVTYTQVVPTPYDQSNGSSSGMRPFANFPKAHPPQNSAPQSSQSFFKPPAFNSREKRQTFWTCCHHCGARYQYYMTFMNVALRCQNCNQDYITHDVGDPEQIHPSSQQNEIPNQFDLPSLNVSKKTRKKSAAESSGNSQTKKSRIVKGKKDKAATSDLSDEHLVIAPDGNINYPDPEFNNFEKDRAENCFAVDQVWALYDDVDSMPRFYARVNKILSPGFKLMLTWLEPNLTDLALHSLPATCGHFVDGKSHETENRLMFSHQMYFTRNPEGAYVIYPRKDETWALYKKWDIKKGRNPEKRKPKYEFQHVVVSSDYVADVGIGVTYLSKVEGFVYLFEEDGLQETVLPSELYRFSHRIPSVKMTGKEKNGVPAGSFELDPGSLMNIKELSYPPDVKKDKCPTGTKKEKSPLDVEEEESPADVKKGKKPVGNIMKPIVLGLAAKNGPLKNHILKTRKSSVE
ncbi:hypothetical protein ACFE04_028918 [Oxalis oulophora]